MVHDGWVAVCAATYASVLVAELVGDRSLYAIGSLATRLRAAPLYAGISAAFAAKMLVAVLAGDALARLPGPLLRIVGAASLVAAALMIWRESRETGPGGTARAGQHPAGLAFATVFFSEWADPGQLAAAGLSAHYHAPVLVWLAATLALLTKGVLAVTLGARLGRVLPATLRRNLAFGTLILLAALVGLGIEG